MVASSLYLSRVFLMLFIRILLNSDSESLILLILELISFRSFWRSSRLLLVRTSFESSFSRIAYLLVIRLLYSLLPLSTTCIAVTFPSLLIINSLYIGLLIISSLARSKSISSKVISFKLSATSVKPTFGWKKIGASRSDKTESTPSIFFKSFSKFAILLME